MARVAMLLSNDYVNDSRVRREIRELTGAGHEVLLLALLSDRTAPRERTAGLEIVRVPVPRIYGYGGVRLPWTALRWYNYLDCLRKAWDGRPLDLVHANDLDTLATAHRLARSAGARLLYDSHELYVDCVFQFFPSAKHGLKGAAFKLMETWLALRGESLERSLITKVDAVTTVSDGLAEILRDRYRIPLPTVIRNYPDWREVDRTDRLRRFLKAGPGDRVLLHLGLMTYGNGVEMLVRSMKFLPSRFKLVFVGWGWLLPELRRLAESLDLTDRVHFHPAVPSEEVLDVAASADIGLIGTEDLSLKQRYSLPNKLFEYLIAGIPIVATNMPEHLSVMSDHTVGHTCEAEPKAVAAAVAELDRELASEGAEYFRKQCRRLGRRYTWDEEGKRYREVVEAILAGTRPASEENATPS